jgi:hypothetical protein
MFFGYSSYDRKRDVLELGCVGVDSCILDFGLLGPSLCLASEIWQVSIAEAAIPRTMRLPLPVINLVAHTSESCSWWTSTRVSLSRSWMI